MADGLHVHAQLVRTAGMRQQFDPAAIASGIVSEPPITRQRRFSVRVADLLARPRRPVANERQIDFALLGRQPSFEHGDISLLHGTRRELGVQDALHRQTACHDQQAGGVHVEAMHHLGIGEFGRYPAG